MCGRKAIHQFVYKNLDLVKVSNLQMVDDLIDIQECGFKSEASNMFIKNQIEMKLLPSVRRFISAKNLNDVQF